VGKKQEGVGGKGLCPLGSHLCRGGWAKGRCPFEFHLRGGREISKTISFVLPKETVFGIQRKDAWGKALWQLPFIDRR
jgi:hypothetical protein